MNNFLQQDREITSPLPHTLNILTLPSPKTTLCSSYLTATVEYISLNVPKRQNFLLCTTNDHKFTLGILLPPRIRVQTSICLIHANISANPSAIDYVAAMLGMLLRSALDVAGKLEKFLVNRMTFGHFSMNDMPASTKKKENVSYNRLAKYILQQNSFIR